MQKDQRESVSKNSVFIILSPSGKEIVIDEKFLANKSFSGDKALNCLLNNEFKGLSGKEVPSIKAMQKLELVDYEPVSDNGHFRFYPKGFLVYELIKAWADEIAEDLNCFKIKTPILYNWEHPAIRAQGESFHERHYLASGSEKDKEFVMRFADDFGLFSMLSDVQMSYRQLPLRIYEFSDSFRYEQHGELSGLKRLRAFSMPDIHSFCEDIDQGMEEYKNLFKNYANLVLASGIEYGVVFRVVADFYEKNKQEICELLSYCGKSAMIEILPERKHYWAMKHEFCSIDAVGGVCQLSTVQLDIEDAERYGIKYRSRNNEEKGCIICHSSIGSIERWMFSILEDSLKKEKPCLPIWLSPVQIRLIPVSDQHAEKAEAFYSALVKNKIRVDIDDSENSVSWKIRQAEKNWIPFTIIVGDRDNLDSEFSVRLRSGKIESFDLAGFLEKISVETKGFPFSRLSYKYASSYPVFHSK